MIKEIRYTLKNGREKSFLTEDKYFESKTQDGCNFIGFHPVGKSRYKWIPFGMNVNEIIISEAETGRRLETYSNLAW